jgi:hypothetical protein
MRGAIALLALMLLLSGCQSTQQRSAELQRRASRATLAQHSVSVTHQDPSVQVLDSAVVHSSTGAAVVVTLRNRSSSPIQNAPIEITVRDFHRTLLYQNDTPDLEPSLRSVPLMMGGSGALWVDDQLPLTDTPASVSAVVGVGAHLAHATARLSVSGVHRVDEPGVGSGVAGTVTNHSKLTQRDVLVYAVGRRARHITAAGRAAIPEIPPHASAPFQLFLLGDAGGAKIQTSALPTSF